MLTAAAATRRPDYDEVFGAFASVGLDRGSEPAASPGSFRLSNERVLLAGKVVAGLTAGLVDDGEGGDGEVERSLG
jgi:hypothetical protein